MAWMDGDAGWVEPAEQVENLALIGEDMRHWGIWHPERGWLTDTKRIVFGTTSKAMADAQLDMIMRRASQSLDKDGYCVRCIEEWANGR